MRLRPIRVRDLSFAAPSSGEPPETLVWAGIGLAALVVALPATRLVLLIKESNEYTITGEPPTRKAGIS